MEKHSVARRGHDFAHTLCTLHIIIVHVVDFHALKSLKKCHMLIACRPQFCQVYDFTRHIYLPDPFIFFFLSHLPSVSRRARYVISTRLKTCSLATSQVCVCGQKGNRRGFSFVSSRLQISVEIPCCVTLIGSKMIKRPDI